MKQFNFNSQLVQTIEKNNTTMDRRKGKSKKFKRSKNKSLKTEEEIRVDMITALIVKVKLSDL